MTNTVSNAIIRLDMDPTPHVHEEILMGLDENIYIQGKHILTQVPE